MQNIVHPRQMMLTDPYEHVFSKVAYTKVRKGWQDLFHHVILELLPTQPLARSFSQDQGRPTKELYSVAGLIFIMNFNNWTVEQAADAYMFDSAVQYALNLAPGAQSMNSRTVERFKLMRESDLPSQIMTDVTSALISALDKSVKEQRLDSTHVFSNMALFGSTQLMGVTVRHFLSQVRRFQHTDAQYRSAARRRDEQQTPWRKTYSKRAGIKGNIGRLKRRTGLGRLRVRGQASVFMAITIKVAGWNILQAAKVWYELVKDTIHPAGHFGETLVGLIKRVLWAAINKNRPILAINRAAPQ